MHPYVVHRVDARIGDLRSIEAGNNLGRGQGPERVENKRAQRHAVGVAARVGGEARIGG